VKIAKIANFPSLAIFPVLADDFILAWLVIGTAVGAGANFAFGARAGLAPTILCRAGHGIYATNLVVPIRGRQLGLRSRTLRLPRLPLNASYCLLLFYRWMPPPGDLAFFVFWTVFLRFNVKLFPGAF